MASSSVTAPSGVGGLDVRAAGATRHRSSPPRLPCEHQHGRVGGGDRTHLPPDSLALRRREAVHGPEVPDKPVAAAHSGGPHGRHVAFDEPHLRAGLPRALARGVQCLRNHVDAGDVPPASRELDRPQPAAATDVERGPVGRLAPFLLTVEQRRDQRDRRPVLGCLLPGRETKAVEDSVEDTHGDPPSEAACSAAFSWALTVTKANPSRRSISTRIPIPISW